MNNSYTMSLPVIYTIGVYHRTEKDFFEDLTANQVDLFCDIRLRRAVRGAEYAFVNSNRLQGKLQQLGIRYIHVTGLTPTKEIIDLQARSDDAQKIKRREREELSDAFKETYKKEILSHFDMKQFIAGLEKEGCKKVVLFCVEQSAAACHRSLVTGRIKEVYPRIKIIHL